jgi:hypothetical protein
MFLEDEVISYIFLELLVPLRCICHLKVTSVRKSIEFENEDMITRLDLEPVLNELIHSAAYGKQTLGNPKYCPVENVSKITSKHLYSYMKSFYKPSRTVLACVGIGRQPKS